MKLKFRAFFIFQLAFSHQLFAAEQSLKASGYLSAGGQALGSSMAPDTHELEGQRFSTRDVTKFGINLHATLSNEIDLAAQFITTPGTSSHMTPDWYFGKWSNDHYAIRFGQLILPAWLYSETKEVGFTYPWVALPYEVYSLNPVKNFTGLSAGLVNLDIFKNKFTFELFAGGGHSTYDPHHGVDSNKSDININEILGFVASFDRSPDFQYRFSYMRADMDAVAYRFVPIVSNGLAVLTTIAAPFVKGRVDFTSLGGQHWIGKQLVSFELAQRAVENREKIDQELGKTNAGYALVGRQEESWFYYLGYSTSDRQSGNTSGYQPRTDIPTTLLSGSSPKSVSSLSIGLKKDITSTLCGKLQYSSVTTKYPEETKQYNYDASIYGASLDLIF